MGWTPTTRWQVGAHRYLVRRLDHALVHRDTSLKSDPLRSRFRASMIGVLVASIVLAGCAVLAFVRPATTVGDASIVADEKSGAMFVVEEGVLRPVPGLASARLFVGRPDDPVMVSEEELARYPRGTAVGIDGAPRALPYVRGGGRSWSVCDADTGESEGPSTTVVVEPVADVSGVLETGHRVLGDDEALLWTRSEATYLVYGGTRAQVDLTDTVVTRALGIDGEEPVPVSAGVFDAVPEVPAVTAPFVEGAGSATDYDLGGRPVGSVVTVDLGDRSEHYVALRDGVQSIGAATAQLLRFSDSAGRVGVDSIAPDVVARAPETAAPLAVSTFPERPMRVLGGVDGSVTCATWASDTEGRVDVRVTLGAGVPGAVDRPPVRLAGADGGGEALDAFAAPPGTMLHVVTTGMSIADVRRDSHFLVDDVGVRYGVPETDGLDALGAGEAERAPWPVLGLLPEGPVLTVDAARRTHDGLMSDVGTP